MVKHCILAALLALTITACDKPVKTVAHPERARIEKSTQSCNAGPGICSKCGMTLGGKFECSMGFWRNCPGREPVTLRVTPVDTTYESGRVSSYENTDVLSVDGECH